MTTTTRDSRGRFLTNAATSLLRRGGLFGLSRAEQAPFAAAVALFAVILGVLTVLAVVGSVLAAILPQVGTGLAIGPLVGLVATRARRRVATPRASTGTSLVVGTSEHTLTPRS
jgi:hypothetical protein